MANVTIMASVIYAKCFTYDKSKYGKCKYGKCNYGKRIMANETEPYSSTFVFPTQFSKDDYVPETNKFKVKKIYICT